MFDPDPKLKTRNAKLKTPSPSKEMLEGAEKTVGKILRAWRLLLSLYSHLLARMNRTSLLRRE